MNATLAQAARTAIRDVPDFPRPGIVFKDITPLLANPALFRAVTAAMADPYRDQGITHVVAIESRGFIVGAPVAQALQCALVPARKPGKLPSKSIRQDYALEYGTDALEIHADALPPGAKVLIVDDVLATGGTAGATAALVVTAQATLAGYSFLIELAALDGRARLGDAMVSALIRY